MILLVEATKQLVSVRLLPSVHPLEIIVQSFFTYIYFAPQKVDVCRLHTGQEGLLYTHEMLGV